MLKSLTPLLAFALLVSACSERAPSSTAPAASVDSAVADLQAQLDQLKRENADLRATPAVMFGAVQAAGNDPVKAAEALALLDKKFPNSPEARQAGILVAKLRADRDKQEAEAKRLAALGFKALKVNSKLAGDYASITLSGVSQTRRWTVDAYDGSYHYTDAEKGSAYIVARLKVASDNKNPSLPGVALYRSEGARLIRVTSMRYEFARWENYGSYLGNESDYGNDFAHSNVIPMSIGGDAELASLVRPLYLVATKEGCHTRNYERFRNPPVSYASDSCASLKDTLEVADFSDGRLALVPA